MKAIITKTKNGQFHFSLTGANGKKIAQSETYKRKSTMLKTIKKYFPDFKIQLIAILLILVGLEAAATNYYVASGGNDSNLGTQSAPFKTVTKAISVAQAGDVIFLNSGDSWAGPVNIAKSSITFDKYGTGANPVITGFTTVTGWTTAGTNLWQASLSQPTLNMVTVNGTFQPIGRWPGGYNTITSSTASSITSSTLTTNWTGGQVVMRKNHWIIDKAQVNSQSGTTINFTNPNSYSPQNGYGFFIQNHQLACDQPGEWWFSGNKLGFNWGSSPVNVQAATVDNLLNLGSSAFLVFNNIQFTGSNASTVNISTGHDITFNGCSFLFNGVNGFTVGSSAHHITVSNCLGDYTNNNFISAAGSPNWKITGNTIRRTGEVPGMGNSSDGNYIGIAVGASSLIQGNRIASSGYIAIDFRGAAITVDKNVIDTFCNVKDDGAAIYTFTGATPTTYTQRYVTNNIVMNGGGAGAGTNTTNSDAFGIYMDNNSSDVTISDNYVHDCGSSGIFLHGATRITVTRNIVYNSVTTGGYGQMLVVTTKDFADMRNCIVTGNQFVSKTTSQVAAYFSGGKSDYNQWGRFDSNYYSGNKFFAGSATNFGGWQTTSGMEKQSSVGPAQTTPPVPVPPTQVFTNVAQSKAFIKNNCTSGTGSSVVYAVAAGKYSASTQAAADQLAASDISNNGQNYANLNGVCVPKTIIKVVIYYSDGTQITQQ